MSIHESKALLQDLLQRVVVFKERVEARISIEALSGTLGLGSRYSERRSGTLVLKTEAKLKRCGLNVKLVLDGPEGKSQDCRPDAALIRAVMRAHDWIDKLQAGQPPSRIAGAAGVTPSYATRVMRLAFLAPDISLAILEGRQPPELTADSLIRRSAQLPKIWAEQRAALGFRPQPSI